MSPAKQDFFYNMIEFFKKLLNFLGIKFSNKKKENKKNLIDAVNEQDFNTVMHLVQDGVNLDVKNNDGETPLMIAVDKNNDAICELLLTSEIKNRKVADTRIKDNNGETVLMRAVKNGNADITRLLIEHGADLSEKNKDNKNVQELAFLCKNKFVSSMNEKYKDFFKELQKISKNGYYSLGLEEMLNKKKIYEDKFEELDSEMENSEKYSDESKRNKFINEREKYKEIVEVLNNRNKYDEVLGTIKNIEKYEEVEGVLEGKVEYDMINDNEDRVSFLKKWFSSKTLPKEDDETEVLFEYDFDSDDKNNGKDITK